MENSNNNGSNNPRVSFKPVWEFHSLVTLPGFNEVLGGPAVRISVLPNRFPKYSFQVGWQQGQFVPFFRPNADLTGLGFLLTTAQEEVVLLQNMAAQEEAKARADWEAKQKEAEDRKVAKKQRHEQNLQRRREEDRQRTQNSKSGGRK